MANPINPFAQSPTPAPSKAATPAPAKELPTAPVQAPPKDDWQPTAVELERPEAPAEPVKPQPKQEPSQLYTVKVNGVEMKVSLEDLQRGFQLEQASRQSLAQAAEIRRQATEALNLLKTNPKKLLTDPKLGIDYYNLAVEVLNESLQEQALTPEERELKQARAQIAQYEAQRKAEEEARRKAQIDRLAAQKEQELANQFGTALEKVGLVKSEWGVKRMADYMMLAYKNGIDADVMSVAAQVKQDYIYEHRSMYSHLPDETVLELLGNTTADKIRKADVARLKLKETPAPKKVQGKKSERTTKGSERPKLEDIFKR